MSNRYNEKRHEYNSYRKTTKESFHQIQNHVDLRLLGEKKVTEQYKK
jgi:hypothetical protein